MQIIRGKLTISVYCSLDEIVAFTIVLALSLETGTKFYLVGPLK